MIRNPFIEAGVQYVCHCVSMEKVTHDVVEPGRSWKTVIKASAITSSSETTTKDPHWILELVALYQYTSPPSASNSTILAPEFCTETGLPFTLMVFSLGVGVIFLWVCNSRFLDYFSPDWSNKCRWSHFHARNFLLMLSPEIPRAKCLPPPMAGAGAWPCQGIWETQSCSAFACREWNISPDGDCRERPIWRRWEEVWAVRS